MTHLIWVVNFRGDPQMGGIEWNIPDGRVLTVPFPLVASLQDYKQRVDNISSIMANEILTQKYFS